MSPLLSDRPMCICVSNSYSVDISSCLFTKLQLIDHKPRPSLHETLDSLMLHQLLNNNGNNRKRYTSINGERYTFHQSINGERHTSINGEWVSSILDYYNNNERHVRESHRCPARSATACYGHYLPTHSRFRQQKREFQFGSNCYELKSKFLTK